MSTAAQPVELRQDVVELLRTLREFSKISAETVTRELQLGRIYSFADAKPHFETIKALFEQASELPLQLLPINVVAKLQGIVGQAQSALQSISGFDPKNFGANVDSTRQAYINSLRNCAEQAFYQYGPVIAYLRLQTAPLPEYEVKASEILEQMRKASKEQLAVKEQTEQVLAKAQEAAGQVGVVQHAVHFKNEAESYRKAANRWLIATIVAISVATIFGVYSYTRITSQAAVTPSVMTSGEQVNPVSNLLLIQLTVAKLVVFSFLLSAVFWLAKIYRANRHNFVINKHRQNALSTFEAFVKSTEDPQMKDAVLLQATQCIFGPQPTGYITQDSESDGYSKVLEIVRGVSSKEGK